MKYINILKHEKSFFIIFLPLSCTSKETSVVGDNVLSSVRYSCC